MVAAYKNFSIAYFSPAFWWGFFYPKLNKLVNKTVSKNKKALQIIDLQGLAMKVCGDGGIRTPGTLARTLDFESSPINRSGTSPWAKLIKFSGLPIFC